SAKVAPGSSLKACMIFAFRLSILLSPKFEFFSSDSTQLSILNLTVTCYQNCLVEKDSIKAFLSKKVMGTRMILSSRISCHSAYSCLPAYAVIQPVLFVFLESIRSLPPKIKASLLSLFTDQKKLMSKSMDRMDKIYNN
ncbi:MAG: hypothetical protein ACI9S8_003140, partial [Chlamydiales bacterium]